MNVWLRRFFGFWALAGGAIGLGAVFGQVMRFPHLGLAQQIALGVSVAFFGWGVWCGIRMLEGHAAAARGNRNFWLIQIPVLSTPWCAWSLFSGVQLKLSMTFAPLAWDFHWHVLGAQASVDVGASQRPFALGVNLFALCAALYLATRGKR